MGATHFPMRTLEPVCTEMSIHVLAYDMKRATKIIGIADLNLALFALLIRKTNRLNQKLAG